MDVRVTPAHAPLRGGLCICVLHRAEAPDLKRQFRKRDGRVHVLLGLCRDLLHVFTVLTDQGTLHPAFRGVAEDIKRCSAQHLQRCEGRIGALDPGPEGALARAPIRPFPAEKRRRKVIGQL